MIGFIIFLVIGWIMSSYAIGYIIHQKKLTMQAGILIGVSLLFAFVSRYLQNGWIGYMIGYLVGGYIVSDPFQLTQKKAHQIGQQAREKEELKEDQHDEKMEYERKKQEAIALLKQHQSKNK